MDNDIKIVGDCVVVYTDDGGSVVHVSKTLIAAEVQDNGMLIVKRVGGEILSFFEYGAWKSVSKGIEKDYAM